MDAIVNRGSALLCDAIPFLWNTVNVVKDLANGWVLKLLANWFEEKTFFLSLKKDHLISVEKRNS